MKITNKLNLPLPILEAVKNKSYDPGESDITVTSLIGPVQINVLKRRYNDQLVEDAADRIYSLQGESIHTILERAAEGLEDDYIVEKRFYVEHNGWKLGGQIDVFDKKHGILQDYKVTSVYAVKDGPKEEYVKQANINAYIMRKNGHEVKGMQIVAILRDWSKMKKDADEREAKAKGYKSKYPPQQVVILPIPPVADEIVEQYIQERIEQNQQHQDTPDEKLPECSAEDRWAKADVWAVMQMNKAKALRLCNSEKEAESWAQSSNKPDTYIQKRPGVSTRCEFYCPVKAHCAQYRKMKEKNNGK